MKELFYNDLVFLNDITESCDYYWPNFGERYDDRYKNIMKGLDDFENIEAFETYLECLFVCPPAGLMNHFFQNKFITK